MMNPVPGPLPYRTKLEVGQQMIALLTHTYAQGALPDGSGGEPWTPAEMAEALGDVIGLWADFAHYAQAAAAEGEIPDPEAFLQRAALNLAANPPSGPFPANYVDEPDDPW